MKHHTSFFKEHQACENRIVTNDILNELGYSAVRYFAHGDVSQFNLSVDEAFAADPEAHLVLLDDYRILDVNRTLELQKVK